MSVLGICDSHDAGCALIGNGAPLSALNEERFTRNKNETGFPAHSLRYLLKEHGTDDIQAVALAWIGGNAMISRMFPSWDRARRRMWRREVNKPSRLSLHGANLIYKLAQNQNPRLFWRPTGVVVDTLATRKNLSAVNDDVAKRKLYIVEHHLAHSASAYYSSGFKEALVLTLDGAGDGLSGTVSIGDNGSLTRLAEFKASTSLGILYGAATLACDMRYSEDEGKLMSLAAYSYPTKIKELNGICRYDRQKRQLVSDRGTRNEFLLAEYMKDHILSRYSREEFAYAVQAHVERQVAEIVRQWVKETGIHNVAASGGFFSNVIVNRMIEHMPEVKNLFVFPQMGDGGIPYGAALYIDYMLNGKASSSQLDSIYFGPSYTDEQIEWVLKKAKKEKRITFEEVRDPAAHAAELISGNKIVLWFQGRMEYGPRALGNRSVLALPDDPENRNKLNLMIKKRPYYQPFASTILEEDAKKVLEDYVRPNRFMTGANRVNDRHWDYMVAASHIDHTTRPQILGRENTLYRRLIEKVKKRTGIGAVLNTSFNKHGMPIVMAPEDAIWTLENTDAEVLIMGNYLVKKRRRAATRNR